MRRAAGLLTLHVVTQTGQYRDEQTVTPHAFKPDNILEVTPLEHVNEHAAQLYGAAHAVVHLKDSAYWVTETLEWIVAAVNDLARSQ